MKKIDFVNFESSLEANILVDSYLRRITKKLEVVSQSQNPDYLFGVAHFLDDADRFITDFIHKKLCDHEE